MIDYALAGPLTTVGASHEVALEDLPREPVEICRLVGDLVVQPTHAKGARSLRGSVRPGSRRGSELGLRSSLARPLAGCCAAASLALPTPGGARHAGRRGSEPGRRLRLAWPVARRTARQLAWLLVELCRRSTLVQ